MVAVFAYISELNSIFERLCFPHRLVKAARAAMKGVFSVILGHGVSLAIQGEAAMRNAVPVTADDRPKKRTVGNILTQRIVAEDHVVGISLTIGHAERDDNSAIGGDARFDLAASEGVNLHRRTLLKFIERCFVDDRLRLCSQ